MTRNAERRSCPARLRGGSSSLCVGDPRVRPVVYPPSELGQHQRRRAGVHELNRHRSSSRHTTLSERCCLLFCADGGNSGVQSSHPYREAATQLASPLCSREVIAGRTPAWLRQPWRRLCRCQVQSYFRRCTLRAGTAPAAERAGVHELNPAGPYHPVRALLLRVSARREVTVVCGRRISTVRRRCSSIGA